MAIRKDITVTVEKQKSIMSDYIYIYQGDKDIDLYFTIIDDRFEFESTTVKKYNFTIRKPDGDLLPETSITPMADNKAKLTITEEMANEFSEIGKYDILIHLHDESGARITIPEISFEVVQPLMTTNAMINSGLVSNAILDDINEKLIRLNSDGRYIRTIWDKGDLITKEKLNKIEYELVHLDEGQETIEIYNKEVQDARGSEANLKSRLDRTDSQLAEIVQEMVFTFEQLKSYTSSKNKSIIIKNDIVINENITLPKSLNISFDLGYKFIIPIGVTLTLDSQIEAGFKQIFDIKGTLTKTSSYQSGNQNLNSNYVIKADWFGAKGDCVINKDTGNITGTNDSETIKQAFAFAELCSSEQPNYKSSSYVTIEFKPNTQYYIEGDNVLGCQSTNRTGIAFKVDGNGACFYHKPILNTDSLIGNAKKIKRINYSNFSVFTVGFTGRKGKFFNTNGGDDFNSGVQGYFENIVVNDATILNNDSCSYSVMFNIEGNNMVDNFIISNCGVYGYDKFIFNTNKEAVNWEVYKCHFVSNTDYAVLADYYGISYGGISFKSCEVLLNKANETLFKYYNDTVNETLANFSFSGRIECRVSDIKLVDCNSGIFNINDINVTYGGSYTPTDNSINARVMGNGQVNFNNCVLPMTTIVEIKENLYNDYKNAIAYNNCCFYGKDKNLQSYPLIKCESINGVFPYEASVNGVFSHRDILIDNIKYNLNGFSALPIHYKCFDRDIFKKSISKKYVGGKLLLPKDTYINIPPYTKISSLKLFYTNNTNIDAIHINFLKDGVVKFDKKLSLTAYQSGGEVLVNSCISCIDSYLVNFQYFKNGVEISDVGLLKYSIAEIEYTNLQGIDELNGGISGIHNY